MGESVELDSVDWSILEELQNDATLPNRTLAERIGPGRYELVCRNHEVGLGMVGVIVVAA